jgi:hypothetical protein
MAARLQPGCRWGVVKSAFHAAGWLRCHRKQDHERARSGPGLGRSLCHPQRAARQAQVVAALSTLLPPHALLWHSEDTTPYECDGLTAYRQMPLAVVLPETEAQVAGRAAGLPRAGRCRWWRAAPAPA